MPFRWREKLASGGLIGVLMGGSMWLVGLDTLWHGGQPPVWFPSGTLFFCACAAVAGGSALARDAVN